MRKERRQREENPDPEHIGLSFQEIIQKVLDEEGPKMEAFRAKIKELQTLYTSEEIDEHEFFRKLIDDSPVVGIIIDVDGEWMSVDRTEDGKITIEPENFLMGHKIETIVGFDKEGKLEVASKVYQEGKRKPVKKDVIASTYVGYAMSVEAASLNRVYSLLGFELEEEDQISDVTETVAAEEFEALGPNADTNDIIRLAITHFARADSPLDED